MQPAFMRRLPPTQPGADYRVRIFTASEELPFAGHPTLGTARAWLEAGGESAGERIVQECAAGLIQVRRDGDRLAFAAPPLRRSGALEEADALILSACVQMPSLPAIQAVEEAYGKPVLSAATATAWTILKDLGLPTDAPAAGSLLSGRF